MKDNIGFIGMGNMAYAMLSKYADTFGCINIFYTDVNEERLEYVKKITGIDYLKDNKECVRRAKYIVIAVKPHILKGVLEEIKEVITKEHIIISIVAGISTDEIKSGLQEGVRLIRTMPNMAALIGEGMTAVSLVNKEYEKEELDFVFNFLNCFGKAEIIDETLMNAAICANGSSPAYVFIFIEALADSVVKYGIPRETAYKLVAQTVLGAAKMVMETGEHPAKLKDQITSPKGTTIAALSALEEYGFRNAIIKATDRCYEKANHMEI